MNMRPWLLVLLAGAFSAAVPAQTLAQAAAEPPAARSQVPALLLPGHYACEGRNIDGSPYRGLVLVQPRADGRFEFVWRIGTFHRGIGTLDGNVVTVEFGDLHPAVYEIGADGTLTGTWADGKASERLTPIGLQRT